MYASVDVNATFYKDGKIEPIYIRLESVDHTLSIYKVKLINYVEEENFSGLSSLKFECIVNCGEVYKTIELRFCLISHKWVYLGEKDSQI